MALKKQTKNFILDNPVNKGRYYVQYLVSFLEGFYYKILLNRIKPKNIDEKKYKVSICAIFKNESIYLKEWIEFHRIVGIDHFYLYNNFSEDYYVAVLKPYIDRGYVTLVDWPVPQGQMSAYEDCVYRFSSDTKWIAFIDLDEFIVPIEDENIYDWLKQFEKNRPFVIVYWKMFGSSGKIKREKESLVSEDFIVSWRKLVNIGKYFYNTAYEYAPNLKQNINMHYRWGIYNGVELPPVNEFDKVVLHGIHRGNTNKAPVQINHYLVKSYDEYFNIKKKRGDAVYKNSNHDERYFFEHEKNAISCDYMAYRFLVKLKKAMGVEK